MTKLFSVAAVIMTGLVFGWTFSPTTEVARLAHSKTHASESALIILAAHGSRECRDDDGATHNCAD